MLSRCYVGKQLTSAKKLVEVDSGSTQISIPDLPRTSIAEHQDLDDGGDATHCLAPQSSSTPQTQVGPSNLGFSSVVGLQTADRGLRSRTQRRRSMLPRRIQWCREDHDLEDLGRQAQQQQHQREPNQNRS
ncbi:hypothetical protein ACFX1X_021863 [Malus domestica]